MRDLHGLLGDAIAIFLGTMAGAIVVGIRMLMAASA